MTHTSEDIADVRRPLRIALGEEQIGYGGPE